MDSLYTIFVFPWRHLQPQKKKKTRVWFFAGVSCNRGAHHNAKVPWFGSTVLQYFWWKKSCTSWYGKYHKCQIIHRVLHIPGGAGILPSTAVHISNNHNHSDCLIQPIFSWQGSGSTPGREKYIPTSMSFPYLISRSYPNLCEKRRKHQEMSNVWGFFGIPKTTP